MYTLMMEKNRVYGKIQKRIFRSMPKCLKLVNIQVVKELVFGNKYLKIKKCMGVYENDGMKNSQWQELNEGYNKYCQVIYKGGYKNSKKVGRWDIQFRSDGDKSFTAIGGGQYDETGDELKLDNWVEISDNFWSSSQVIYKGGYKNGKKVGKWDMQFRSDGDKSFNPIGGGLYDEIGDGLKLDNWVEISDNFWSSSQVIYNGGYKNGKKVGRWNIWFRSNGDKSFTPIGGGQYDETGDELKLDNWVEIQDNFRNSSQVIYNGGYKNGKKVGKWDIQFRSDGDQPFTAIGGGQYDEIGDGLKFGNWVEISDNFWSSSQVIYNGGYKNGKKVGKWDIQFRSDGDQPFTAIGGGQYDEIGDGLKFGNWVEISDNFWSSSQVIYNGGYKNGKKVGKWDIQFRSDGDKPFTAIGGGLYDETDDGLKLGNWVEISDNYTNSSQVIYKGEYKNGKKVGDWMEFTKSTSIRAKEFQNTKIPFNEN